MVREYEEAFVEAGNNLHLDLDNTVIWKAFYGKDLYRLKICIFCCMRAVAHVQNITTSICFRT